MQINVTFPLKDIMSKRGINQKELAEITGLRPNAISRICKGHLDRIDISHISRIATALDVTDINEIISLEKET